jgi:hypothetical protein
MQAEAVIQFLFAGTVIFFETTRLLFRSHEGRDEEEFIRMHTDPEVRRYVGGQGMVCGEGTLLIPEPVSWKTVVDAWLVGNDSEARAEICPSLRPAGRPRGKRHASCLLLCAALLGKRICFRSFHGVYRSGIYSAAAVPPSGGCGRTQCCVETYSGEVRLQRRGATGNCSQRPRAIAA